MTFERIICIDQVYCTQIEKFVRREVREVDTWLAAEFQTPSSKRTNGF